MSLRLDLHWRIYRASAKYKTQRKEYRNSSKSKAAQNKYKATAMGRAVAAASQAKAYARKYNVPGSWSAAQFLALCNKYGNVCLCCHKRRQLGPDHVIPFCKGGTNHLSNVQPLCWPCNHKKKDNTSEMAG